MLLHQTFPIEKNLDITVPFDARTWWGDIGDRWLRVNMITDAVGNFLDDNTSSEGLTGGLDRVLLKALREIADAVIIGASTLRAEPGSVPRNKQLIIVSGSGEIPKQILDKTELEPIVFSTEPVAQDGFVYKRIADFSANEIIDAASDLDFKKLVCEGGPTLAGLFKEAEESVEWCQTISPNRGNPGPSKLHTPSWPLVAEAHDDAGFVYSRRSKFGVPAVG